MMLNLWDEIEHELNWMRLMLDIWDRKTSRSLGRELRRRVLVVKGLVADGRRGLVIYKPLTKNALGSAKQRIQVR